MSDGTFKRDGYVQPDNGSEVSDESQAPSGRVGPEGRPKATRCKGTCGDAECEQLARDAGVFVESGRVGPEGEAPEILPRKGESKLSALYQTDEWKIAQLRADLQEALEALRKMYSIFVSGAWITERAAAVLAKHERSIT